MWKAILLDKMRLSGEGRLLVLLSILDLLVTYSLLRHPDGLHYEANPIAQWWFARWNIAGMTAFKFTAIALGIASAEIVERRRPGVGRAILLVGITAVLYAVGYGSYLLNQV